MGQVFDMAHSRWKEAYETYQAELSAARHKRPSDIHAITHRHFAAQGRANLERLIEEQARAGE